MTSPEYLDRYRRFIHDHGRAAKQTKVIGGVAAVGGLAARVAGRKSPQIRRMGSGVAIGGGIVTHAGYSMAGYNKGRKIIHKHLSGKKLSPREQHFLRARNPSKSLAREHASAYQRKALQAWGKDEKRIGEHMSYRNNLVEAPAWLRGHGPDALFVASPFVGAAAGHGYHKLRGRYLQRKLKNSRGDTRKQWKKRLDTHKDRYGKHVRVGAYTGMIGGLFAGDPLGAERRRLRRENYNSSQKLVRTGTTMPPIEGVPANPAYTHGGLKKSVEQKMAKRAKVNFLGYGRSLGTNEALIEDAYAFIQSLDEGVIGRTIDIMTVPKNQRQMTKLANRGTAGHIGHAALRMVAGAPLMGGGGIINAVRYGAKVRNAKRGLYRHGPGNAGD
jgi:hypothetical protein